MELYFGQKVQRTFLKNIDLFTTQLLHSLNVKLHQLFRELYAHQVSYIIYIELTYFYVHNFEIYSINLWNILVNRMCTCIQTFLHFLIENKCEHNQTSPREIPKPQQEYKTYQKLSKIKEPN